MKYLLGTDADGIEHYLTAPSWDRDWHWGFGYITTKDSHQHADGIYKHPNSSDYDHNIFTGDYLVTKNFTRAEGWGLRELMATFYQLKKQAELVGRGGMNITDNPLAKMLTSKHQANRINTKLIPAVTQAITDILK